MLTMRQWRRVRDFTQEEMAKRLNVHINTYQNWEQHPEKISIANAIKITQVLNVPMNDISFTKEVSTH